MAYQTQFICIQDLPPAASFLSAAESAYWQTLRAEKRKGDWLGGRFALKVLLARQDGLLPACSLPAQPEEKPELSAAALAVLQHIEVHTLPSGAPQVYIGGRADRRAVSITHSHGWAAAAVSAEGSYLGIDLEKITHRMEAWAHDFFTPAELAGGQDDAYLTRLWTQKEAVVKLLGRGLSLNTQEVQLEGDQVTFTGRAEQAWQTLQQPQIGLRSVPFGPDFIYTVAYAAAPQSGKFGKI